MALDNKKDLYGNAVGESLAGAREILQSLAPRTVGAAQAVQAQAQGSGFGERLGLATKAASELRGNFFGDVANAVGSAGQAIATAPNGVQDFARNVSGPAIRQFAEDVSAGSAGRKPQPVKSALSGGRTLSLGGGNGVAPAFPQSGSSPQSAAQILSNPVRSFDAGATDSRLGTLNAAQLEEMAAKQRAHNQYMFNRKAEIMDGRAPVEGGRIATIENPKYAAASPSGATVRNAQDNQTRLRLGEIAAGTEAAKIAAAERANTIDPTVLGKAKGAGSAFDALAALGGSNKATADAVMAALSNDTQAAPNRRIDSLMQQILSPDATPEQTSQLRSTLLALQGKDTSPRYVLAESSTTDPSGQVLRNQIPFNPQTGQYAPPPSAQPALQAPQAVPSFAEYALQIKARNPGATISDQDLFAQYRQRFGG